MAGKKKKATMVAAQIKTASGFLCGITLFLREKDSFFFVYNGQVLQFLSLPEQLVKTKLKKKPVKQYTKSYTNETKFYNMLL